MNDERQNELQTMYQLGQEAGSAKLADGLGIPYAVIPADSQMVNLERLMAEPAWKRGRVELADLPSFTRYFKAQSVPERTVLFADANSGYFQAVFDYHKAAPEGGAGWKDHSAVLRLPNSAEWQRWVELMRKQLSQEIFANFIEENMASILKPDGAALLEMTRSLTAKITSEFTSVIRGAGETRSSLEVRDATGSAGVVLPETIDVAVPVYKGFTRFGFTVRLRVHIEAKKLTLSYVIPNLEKLLDAAHAEIVEAVKTATGVEPLIGRMDS